VCARVSPEMRLSKVAGKGPDIRAYGLLGGDDSLEATTIDTTVVAAEAPSCADRPVSALFSAVAARKNALYAEACASRSERFIVAAATDSGHLSCATTDLLRDIALHGSMDPRTAWQRASAAVVFGTAAALRNAERQAGLCAELPRPRLQSSWSGAVVLAPDSALGLARDAGPAPAPVPGCRRPAEPTSDAAAPAPAAHTAPSAALPPPDVALSSQAAAAPVLPPRDLSVASQAAAMQDAPPGPASAFVPAPSLPPGDAALSQTATAVAFAPLPCATSVPPSSDAAPRLLAPSAPATPLPALRPTDSSHVVNTPPPAPLRLCSTPLPVTSLSAAGARFRAGAGLFVRDGW
jgi:hypothetical protein